MLWLFIMNAIAGPMEDVYIKTIDVSDTSCFNKLATAYAVRNRGSRTVVATVKKTTIAVGKKDSISYIKYTVRPGSEQFVGCSKNNSTLESRRYRFSISQARYP